MAEETGAAEAGGVANFDTHAVMAALRKGDEGAFNQAYRIVFGNEMGRTVLAHILAEGGVGRPFGGELSQLGMAYHQGAHDYACEIRDRAGFDPSSAVVLTMTGQLEGRDDEPSAFAEPDPEIPE